MAKVWKKTRTVRIVIASIKNKCTHLFVHRESCHVYPFLRNKAIPGTPSATLQRRGLSDGCGFKFHVFHMLQKCKRTWCLLGSCWWEAFWGLNMPKLCIDGPTKYPQSYLPPHNHGLTESSEPPLSICKALPSPYYCDGILEGHECWLHWKHLLFKASLGSATLPDISWTKMIFPVWKLAASRIQLQFSLWPVQEKRWVQFLAGWKSW